MNLLQSFYLYYQEKGCFQPADKRNDDKRSDIQHIYCCGSA